jgi:outer membrane protein OmpA-like peptidoglycan-associated protein
VYAGEVVNATADAKDPDNDPLTYAWRVDGQGRPAKTRTLKINTGGFAGGNHSVAVTVSDDRGDSQSDTESFRVREKVVIQMDRFRPDNVAKAKLDEIAVKMQQNTQLKAVITGHTDDRGSEKGNIKAGQRRADAAKAYLVKEHSIAENRIETKSAGEGSPISDNSTAEGRKENRRVEVELFVP